MNTGILYIVGTPIGNLDDITLRALRTLKEVDLIACEDTRVTSKLLSHFEIKKSLVSIHQHSKENQLEKIVERMKSGENVALVTDAGTPGISDPGNKLVDRAVEKGVQVVPIPGVSALTTLLSVSGIDTQRFVFWGFPPHKKGRETFLRGVAESKIPVIYYDSVHRVIRNLEFLLELAPEKHAILGRELTKMFEEIVRGKISEVLDYFQENADKQKGEFTIIVY